MLSSIPKLVDKNFVIGFIIPVLLGAAGILAVLRDIEPFRTIYGAALDADDFAKLTVMALLLWTVAILLLVMNNAMYRLLEGYVGPCNRRSWRDKLRGEYAAERAELQATYAIVTDPRVMVSPELERDYYADARRFAARWPSHRHLVLPTRFGNVVRAFETYSNVAYGVDAIPAWLRLQGVMPKDAQTQVEDARTQVDFFVNILFLALLFAVVAAAHCGFNAYALRTRPDRLPAGCWGYALAAAAGVLVCRMAYLGAVARAAAWGDLVKSAFDLYLPALARQLGYALPPTEAQRRKFWGAVTSSFLYHMPMTPEYWPAAKPDGKAASGKVEAADDDDDELV